MPPLVKAPTICEIHANISLGAGLALDEAVVLPDFEEELAFEVTEVFTAVCDAGGPLAAVNEAVNRWAVSPEPVVTVPVDAVLTDEILVVAVTVNEVV